MTVEIHHTAIVSAKADLADGVRLGPFSIVGDDVRIGRGTVIGPHVQIEPWTILGEDNQVGFGCTLGNPSVDRKYRGGRSYARIGDRNVLLEYVSISRATTEEGATTVGDDHVWPPSSETESMACRSPCDQVTATTESPWNAILGCAGFPSSAPVESMRIGSFQGLRHVAPPSSDALNTILSGTLPSPACHTR